MGRQSFNRDWLTFGLLFSAGLFSHTAAVVAEETSPNLDREIEMQTLTNPLLELKQPERVWRTDMQPVWEAALRHPESDLRCEVASSILQAHRLGMPGLAELREALRDVMQSPHEMGTTKTAVAAALVELDCRDLAPLLAAQAAVGPLTLQQVVEPGLARWDYGPLRETWLARLRDPTADTELVRMAAESLAVVGEPRAIEPLEMMLLSPVVSPMLRLAAARSLSKLDPPNLLRWSNRLLANRSADPMFDVQLGVELLIEQSSPAAIELLERYAECPYSPAVAVALRRLFDLDPARVLVRSDRLIVDPDANVRGITIEALATDSAPQSIRWLALALDDRVPALRVEARRSLLRHAGDPAMKPVVIERTLEALDSDRWRSIEQSIIVLTELEQRQINDHLIELLGHPRGEVKIAAAWAIKHLFESDGAEAVLEAASKITADTKRTGVTPDLAKVQAHLFEKLGLLRHRPAVALLGQLVPKGSHNYAETRAAAIWALGFLLDSQQDAEMIRSLEARMADVQLDPAEEEPVRAASAIALGRIADPSTLDGLQRWYRDEGPSGAVGRSSGWAIMQMTGEPLPEAEAYKYQISNWSIQPTDTSPGDDDRPLR